jgi:hypothetical protein
MQSGEPEQVESRKTHPKEEPVNPEVKQPTLEEVRGLLARKSQEGKSSEVKSLIEKFGASRLSEIQPEGYLALMAEAEGVWCQHNTQFCRLRLVTAGFIVHQA